MGQEFLRVFKTFDIEEVKQHLLIMGDLSADCGTCHELGIDGYAAKECPGCGAAFKYLTSRRLENHSGERFKFAKRMTEKRPDLVIIDYLDYTKIMGQKKARDFFG